MRIDLSNPEHRKVLERMNDTKTGRPAIETIFPKQRRDERILNDDQVEQLRVSAPTRNRCFEKFEFVLPYPISTNHLYVFGDDGRRHLTKAAREYKKRAVEIALSAGVYVLHSLVSLTIHVYRPTKRGDTSNRIKLAEDAMKGVAWIDDEQVDEIHIYRHLDRRTPRMEITITQKDSFSA